MTTSLPELSVDGETGLRLRPSPELASVPVARAPTPTPAAAQASASASAMTPPLAGAGTPVPGVVIAGFPLATGTLVAGGAALLATVGWLVERRQRILLEGEKDSVMWAGKPLANLAQATNADRLEDILPDSPDPAEAARTIYVTAIGETTSRREATLIDLHQLHGKLTRRRARGDTVAAILLLQQHLVDFRYTSPWLFLELHELYKVLHRQKEWDIAREAFRKRFGQNAPAWAAPSTADAGLADDPQLAREITRMWPYREARMYILRWMLGEHDMRQRCSGPPLLSLGVYRDLMTLDHVLDEMMVMRSPNTDPLL
ncbi:MAG: hypothetical protein EOO25_12145 [Comamonadaceae bacterium]|nr:MAG: hypothetical protein EOO25_12145 [Comamonadaceae bacterium]